MATVEQQQQPTAPSPFAPPPSSPLSPVASTPVGAGSPSSPSPSPSPFDIFPLISDDPPVRALNGFQYYHIHEAEYTRRMPDDTLFPWLHGVDIRNHQQNLFFGVDESTAPQHRGVTVVQGDANAIACGLTLSPMSLSSQSSSALQMRRCQLVGAVLPDEILNAKTPNREFRGFLRLKDQEGINLRNFKSQVVRYASVSDVVVYGEHGLDENVLEVAKQVAYAQQLIREERPNGLEYETYVIVEPFSFFEKEFPELVAIDSKGMLMNKVNFFDQEREEMRALTQATEISHNVWLGNSQDVPVFRESNPADSAISLIDDNPHQLSVCIEAHDLADMPSQENLALILEKLKEFQGPAPTRPSDLCMIDCFATAQNSTTESHVELLGTSMLELCEFIAEVADGCNRRVLIHCTDGYTETSTLALTYLMYKEKLSLPDAYLRLQQTRSFFVYSNDVKILEAIERRLNVGVPNEHLWFKSDHFEGSFPSRILPFLYLGNLNHASNPNLLKALGITHVLSVGEDPKLDPKEFTVHLMDNLFDDGIDSLWNHLDLCVGFIENTRETNGRVLIHCRVGVSRSATITIAYIMRHLKRSLVDSYLFVRARRLNVIIQPNLRFMYELLQYEHKLMGRMGISWTSLAREIHYLNMCYVGC